VANILSHDREAVGSASLHGTHRVKVSRHPKL